MPANKVICAVLLTALLGAAPNAFAETRYVVDVLVINLRDAPSAGAQSLSHLRTGDEFEVLGAQGNYLRVRTPAGEEGWVPQQYTTAEIPKDQVIAGLRQDLARAKKRAATAEDERTRLQAELGQTRESSAIEASAASKQLAAARQEADESGRRHQQIKKDYDALLAKSKRVLEITAERDSLLEKHAQLQDRVQKLDGELASVTRSNLVTGLLVGGGLVLAGWVLGSTSRKKKSRFSVG